jgi:signal transduction histidine kinase
MLQGPSPAEVKEARICRARRLEVIGQLTGGIAHDFNNILTVISGTIEILAESVADRPDLAAIAKLIGEAAARGADLTSHLLAFAHGQRSQPREVDLNSLLVDAARLLRPTLGEQIEIDTLLAKDTAPVVVDPGQLMTVILNLAIDARDALQEGGRLGFATANAARHDIDGNADNEVVAGAGAGAIITVRACGPGISVAPERTFASVSIARDFIARCGGTIDVRGEAGDVTTIRIHLPQASGQLHPLANSPDAGEIPDRAAASLAGR